MLDGAQRRVPFGTTYRDKLWPQQRAANEAWIDGIRPLAGEPAHAAADELARLLGGTWPADPVRVDVLAHANWAGAYTSVEPPHLRIGSRQVEPDGADRRFEALIHESAHLVAQPLMTAIAEAARERGLKVPHDLWHAVLFDSAGEVARRSRVTPQDYVPYAEAHGLWKGRWAPCREAILAHWRPWTAGEIAFEAAVGRIVEALGEEAQPDGRR